MTITYGTAPGAFLAIRALLQLTTDESQDFPKESDQIFNNTKNNHQKILHRCNLHTSIPCYYYYSYPSTSIIIEIDTLWLDFLNKRTVYST